MTRLRSLAALLCVAALAACEKTAVQDITAPLEGNAFVKFHNVSVGSPSVNFFANTTKVTATSSTSCSPPPTTPNPACTTTGVESTTGVAYGASALGGNYAAVAPGTATLTGKISATTDNGLAVASVSQPLTAGKFYSYFMSGVYNTALKTTDAFVVEDNLPTTFDYSKSYIRIVNASANAPAFSATAQLQGAADVVTIGSNIPYKQASPIVTLTPGLTDFVFTFGTNTVRLTGANLSGGHVFTIVLRGDATSTVAANQLALTSFVNR